MKTVSLSRAKEKWNILKQTAFLRIYAWQKIPLLWWVRPTLVEINPQKIALKIPLNRRTQNHLRVMYFGALAMGAEAAIAVKAVHAIHESKHKIDFIFKDFQAQFLKRAEDDVVFICEEGDAIMALVEKAQQSGERESQTFHSFAVVPKKDPLAKVAEFSVTLSLKRRK